MLDIEIDGKAGQVPEGGTVMEAAERMGMFIPHFCYHKKLSIAANCRMCLVEVENARKPLPACATPVTQGMKVFTHSKAAVEAQRAVMEFLLINHPLDCPICDQGGECQLQDLAVGYGADKSFFHEKKHTTAPKEVGPLISMHEMSRCIHCTRCVRFGREIGGLMEFGMAGRSVHSEITTFLGHTVDSELSGNMIDVCPVGALTSKPFRYTARGWELRRKRTVSPHDSVGANLVAQVKGGKVMRVLPFENEAVNECWISDKERFSYPALNGPDRLLAPMVKQGGEWQEADWSTALDYVAHALSDIAQKEGPDALAALAAPFSTLEELYLLKKLMAGLGSKNLDSRLRTQDFSTDGKRAGVRWLGMPIADMRHLESALVVGSFLRKDHPLLAQRLRHAAQRHGGEISLIHVAGDDPRLPLFRQQSVPPAQLSAALAAVVKAAAQEKGVADCGIAGLDQVEATADAAAIAKSLAGHERAAVFLGNAAQQSADAGLLHALGLKLAELTGASFGFLGEAGNSVGADALGMPGNTAGILGKPRSSMLLWQVEPELDCANPQKAMAAVDGAKTTAFFSVFDHAAARKYADVLLPVAPFTETSGTFINAEGRIQGFAGAVPPKGQARPGWKVLCALGRVLGLAGFDFEGSQAVLAEALGAEGMKAEFIAGRDNGLPGFAAALPAPAQGNGQGAGLVRIADVPIHFADPLARHSEPLQQTADAAPPAARMSEATLKAQGLANGDPVKVRQGEGTAMLHAFADATVPEGCVRVAAAHPSVGRLGGMFDEIFVERA
jgi:NADH-quinone oxidoreductase subunit G